MASCPKCGKPKLRKDAFNRRRCPKCGILRGPEGMDRSGFVRLHDELKRKETDNG